VSENVEHELFQKARAGDRAAFDCLQEELEAPVRRFIRRLVGQSHSEDDIVQDAFLALYMNLEHLDSGEHLRPFLFRVVRNLCYDELRRKGRFQFASLDQGPDESGALFPPLADSRSPPDEEVHWILLYSEVQKAMDRVPELQRQTMILYCEQDLTYQQIAEAMATDIGTVKSRIHYGRKNLRKLLKPEILEALGIEKEGRDGKNKG
jgi:RNA polymerase sigma-70 factor (ECF subfamily)